MHHVIGDPLSFIPNGGYGPGHAGYGIPNVGYAVPNGVAFPGTQQGTIAMPRSEQAISHRLERLASLASSLAGLANDAVDLADNVGGSIPVDMVAPGYPPPSCGSVIERLDGLCNELFAQTQRAQAAITRASAHLA